MLAELSRLQDWGIAVGVVSGVGGLAIGIMNAIHQYHYNRPHLQVRFNVRTLIDRTFGPGGEMEEDIGVLSIVNIGLLPAVPSSVGIRRTDGDTIYVVSPQSIGGGDFATQLDPGHARALRCILHDLMEPARNGQLRRAFVVTQAGDVFYGTRKEMRKFAAELEALDQRQRSASAGDEGAPQVTEGR
jgi:hypothetical protein